MRKPKAQIINLGLNNIFSIEKAIQKSGFITNVMNIREVKKKNNSNDILILPGVGNFHSVMKNLTKYGVDEVIKKHAIIKKKPILGICLGMQLLFEESDETIKTVGLSILEGKVKSFPKKIRPNIGWCSTVNIVKNSLISKKEFFYFVHSNYCIPKDKNYILTRSYNQNFQFCSSILKENIIAVQFHPEKSGKIGLDILKKIKKKFFK